MSAPSHPTVLAHALNQQWHMLPDALENTVLPIVRAIAEGTIHEMRARYLETKGVTHDEALQALAERKLIGRIDSEGNPVIYTGGSRVKFMGTTAILPIHGTIFRKANFFMYFSGGTSSNMVISAANQLAQMDNIENVVLDVDSPGGSVGGLVLATAALRRMTEAKNVISVSEDLNASAAYMLSSVAPIMVNPSSITGSIGTIGVLQNVARKAANEGYDIRLVRSTPSTLKAVPNSIEPLSDEGIGIIQRSVDKHFNDFIKAISLNKGISMDDALELAGKGEVHDGEEAIKAGLADGVGTVASTVEEFEASNNRKMFAFMGEQFQQLKALISGSAGNEAAADLTANQPETVMSNSTEAPAVEANQDSTTEINELKAELEAAKAELAEKEAKAAEESKANAEAENKEFVAGLAKEGKIKPMHASRLEALLNSLQDADDIAYVSGTQQVEESPAAVLRGFLNALPPVVPLNEVDDSDPVTVATLEGDSGALAKQLRQVIENGDAKSPSEALRLLKKRMA
jgi:capsid assembly protease